MNPLLRGSPGEPLRIRVAGFYRTQALAEAMVRRALRLPGMAAGQIRMLGPQHAHHSGRDLMMSPREVRRQRGLLRTLRRARGLAAMGGAVASVLMGWLASLPPDQTQLIQQLQSGLRAGEWAVVLHPSSAHQATLSKDLLDSSRVPVARWL